MRTIITMALCMGLPYLSVAQTLDYSNYHIKYTDSFNTYSRRTDHPDAFKSDTSNFWNNWNVVENPRFYSWGPEIYDTAHVTMPEHGVIRLTENVIDPPIVLSKLTAGRNDTVFNHRSGLLYWKKRVGFGITEAVIKLPSGNPLDSVEPAFWIPWNGYGNTSSEIDIVDNNPVWTKDNTIMYAVFNKASDACNTVQSGTYEENIAGYHKYSALWTPDRVSFYFDGKLKAVIPYNLQRTDAEFHKVYIHMITKWGSVDNRYMEIKSVTYWEQNIDTAAHKLYYSAVPNPIVDACNELQPGLVRSAHLHMNIEAHPSDTPTYASTVFPTVIETNSTDIRANFLADQTKLRTVRAKCAGDPEVPNNSYLEIRPLPINVQPKVNSEKANEPPPTSLPELEYINTPPGRSVLLLRWRNNTGGNLLVKIKDATGRTRVSRKATIKQNAESRLYIDIRRIPAGVYFIESSRVGNERSVLKFIKIK